MKTKLLILLWVLIAAPLTAMSQVTVYQPGDFAVLFIGGSNTHTAQGGRCPSESGSIEIGADVFPGDNSYLLTDDYQLGAFPAGTNVTTGPTPSGSGWTLGNGSNNPKVTGLAAGNYDLYMRYKNNVDYPYTTTDWQIVALNIALSSSNGTVTGNQPTRTNATCGNSDGSISVTGITRSNYSGSGTLYAALYDNAGNLVAGTQGAVASGSITFSSIAAGTYTVRGWDSGVFGTGAPLTTTQVGCHFAIGSSVTVSASSSFTVGTTTTATTCAGNDGSVTVNVTPSNGTYYFFDGSTWQTMTNGSYTLNGLTPGDKTSASYAVSLYSNGNGACANADVDFTIPGATNSNITVQTTTSATSCAGNDGSVTVNVTPSNGTYYFFDGTAWQAMTNGSYTLNGLTAGDKTSANYAVSLYSNGNGTCSNVDVDFTIPSGSTIPFTVGATPTHPTCPGTSGSVSVNITPTSGTYYIELVPNSNNWTLVSMNPVTVPNVPSGSFSARISTSATGASCVTTASTTINAAPSQINATVTGGIKSIAITNPTGGTGILTYSASTGSTAGTFAAAPLTVDAGTYNVWAKDANGCERQIATGIVVSNPTARAYGAAEVALRVYPNPTQGNMTITAANLKAASVELQVVDLLGKTVQRLSVTTNGGQLQQALTLSQAGIYFVKLTDGTHSYVQKVVVE